MTLGELLVKYRKEIGLSQKKLARQIGIDPTTLSRLERIQGQCQSFILKKVSDFFNMQISSDFTKPDRSYSRFK